MHPKGHHHMNIVLFTISGLKGSTSWISLLYFKCSSKIRIIFGIWTWTGLSLMTNPYRFCITWPERIKSVSGACHDNNHLWLIKPSFGKEFHSLSSYGTSGLWIIKLSSRKVMFCSEIITISLSVSCHFLWIPSFFDFLWAKLAFFGSNYTFSFPCNLIHVELLLFLRLWREIHYHMRTRSDYRKDLAHYKWRVDLWWHRE